ncbi:hypothetical protein [Caballeronia sp. GaOx3]|uniref:hypothetical protein n=1 Tax=Caballeronia sp. GaOx3 TaxID=2921740 RepID=UPI002029386C|nr:hypothetical protein [Caballeronia sp. GaOx3]
MSARAYISYSDVPSSVIAISQQRVSEETLEELISFPDCPLTGQILTQGGTIEIEFPFPRSPEIRNSLINWFMKWGISFEVAM